MAIVSQVNDFIPGFILEIHARLFFKREMYMFAVNFGGIAMIRAGAWLSSRFIVTIRIHSLGYKCS